MHVSLQADFDKVFDENRTRQRLAALLEERRRRAGYLRDPERRIEVARIDLACSLLPFLRGEALAAAFGQFYLPPALPTWKPKRRRDRERGASRHERAAHDDPDDLTDG